jgi:hypothetical protein
VPSPSTSARAADVPPTRDANPKTYPADKQGESAEEEKDGVTKSGHYDVRDPNILFSFHHQRAPHDDTEPQGTQPIAEAHHQAHSIDRTESTHPTALMNCQSHQHPPRERHNHRPCSTEAQPEAHTPGHRSTDPTPPRSHHSPIARSNNRLRTVTKHVNLRYHHICQAIDAGTIPLSRATANDSTVDKLIKLLVRTNLRQTRGTPRDLRGSVSGNI